MLCPSVLLAKFLHHFEHGRSKGLSFQITSSTTSQVASRISVLSVVVSSIQRSLSTLYALLSFICYALAPNLLEVTMFTQERFESPALLRFPRLMADILLRLVNFFVPCSLDSLSNILVVYPACCESCSCARFQLEPRPSVLQLASVLQR